MEAFNTPNGLTASLDFVRFTVHNDSLTVPDVIKYFGYQETDFATLDRGANGYKSQIVATTCKGLAILSDGSTDMGIHVCVSGGAMHDFLTHFMSQYGLETLEETIPSLCEAVFSMDGKFTRVDLALDDIGGNYWSPMAMQTILDKGICTSKWRSWNVDSRKNFDGELLPGHTVYMGNRKSSLFLRIYDKQAEQNQGKKEGSAGWISDSWTRWELEIKDDYANRSAEAFLDGETVPSLLIGLLRNYFSIRVRGKGKNKSRWAIDPEWERFCADVEKATLYQKPLEKSVEEKLDYARATYGRTMAVLVCSLGNKAVKRIVVDGITRLKQSDILAIRSFVDRTGTELNKEFLVQYGLGFLADSISESADPCDGDEWMSVPEDFDLFSVLEEML